MVSSSSACFHCTVSVLIVSEDVLKRVSPLIAVFELRWVKLVETLTETVGCLLRSLSIFGGVAFGKDLLGVSPHPAIVDQL